MCKNVILNTAIDVALDLPRKALWTATAVTVVFSLDAGLAIVGDTLDLKAVGTSQVYAAPGALTNQNVSAALGSNSVGNVTIAASMWVNVSLTAFPGATAFTVGSTQAIKQVVYASELFRGATLPDAIPGGTTGSANYQAICYQVPGVISNSFTIDFDLTGAQFAAANAVGPPTPPWIFGIGGTDATNICGGDGGVNLVKGIASGAKATLTVTYNAASCSLPDGAQLCLVYKLAGSSVAALKEPGKTVTMSATLKRTDTGTIVGQASPIVVAESKQGANFALAPESDGQQTYIAASSGNKEFISSEVAGTITADDLNAYVSTTQAKIGYITYSAAGTVGLDGSATFAIAGTGATDTATLVIENGQFSASPGGASAGRVYLGGVTGADAAITSAADKWTATWNLTTAQLATIVANQTAATKIAVPIIIKVDGFSEIKDTLGGDDPQGTLTVKLGGTTALSDVPPTSALRRIAYDGKVCKVFNIPSPDGAADALSLRITNDSEQTGTITGTLYNEAGEQQGDNLLDLLAGHIDYTKNPPAARVSMGTVLGSDGVTQVELLGPRETVILNSQNIATKFGPTSWPAERWVLEIQSSIPKIEVFNLLRNVENITLQPLSNVSAGADGVECSPIP